MRRRRSDRASVLMLMPAAVLIMLMLAAVAVDMSVVFLRQRQASAMAADIANDIVTAALDTTEIRASGTYRLDERAAERIAVRLADASDLGPDVVGVSVDIVGPETVRVTVTLRARHIFTKAVPGASDSADVHASATADAFRGDDERRQP